MVVCAIIERQGRFLAAQRSASQTNALLWEFPGGKVDFGETPGDALRREIREEMGVEIEPIMSLGSSRHRYPWIHIELIPFVCRLTAGSIVPHEHKDIRWVGRTEALVLPWAEADKPVLAEYLRLYDSRLFS